MVAAARTRPASQERDIAKDGLCGGRLLAGGKDRGGGAQGGD